MSTSNYKHGSGRITFANQDSTTVPINKLNENVDILLLWIEAKFYLY